MKKSLKMPASISVMNRTELIRYSIEGIGIAGLFGYFFYRSWIATVLMLPLIYPYLVYKGREVKKKRRAELMLQFKEMLGSLNGSLQAGYSIENAFVAALDDMRRMYGDKAVIVKELTTIRKGLDNNYDISAMIGEFAARSGIEEIESFAAVISIGRRSGGNLLKNMETYVRIIDEKTEVMQDIETMVSSGRFEQRIMNVVPFLLIFYVELSNKGFFSILYHNIFGNIVMTVTMAVYLLSVYLSDRIVDIRI